MTRIHYTAALLAASALLLPITAQAGSKADISVEQATSKPLKAWGRAIGRQLRREMQTPEHFDTAGDYGAVTYRLTVGRDGHVVETALTSRSGFERLDASAADTIANMQQLPAMPAQIAASGAQVDVRLAYLPLKSSSFITPRTKAPKTEMVDLADHGSQLKITLLGQQDGHDGGNGR